LFDKKEHQMETLFAKLSASGEVLNVIVAGQDFVDAQPDASSYVQTFADANGDPAKGYNYASIGGKYFAAEKAFAGVQPYASWVVDAKFQWQPPVPAPAAKAGVYYQWDEAAVNWAEVAVTA
jgi:hypothetical protein